MQKPRQKSGRRAMSISTDKRGRYVYAEARPRVTDLALDATLRAAAPHQVKRGRGDGSRVILERRDLRQKVRKRKVGNLIVFAVDGSGSMDADRRMAVTKGAALSLLQDAYVRRDKVAVIVFRNRSAEVVVPPTGGAALAKKRLSHVNVGGTTPLTQGLISAYGLIRTEQLRDSSLRPLLVVISDGHANVPVSGGDPVKESREIAARIKADKIETLFIDSTIDSIDPALSNREGELIDFVHEARANKAAGIVINAGGYSHTSIALHDALAAVKIPAVEVHISNIYARESFRHHSFTARAAFASLCGFGIDGYRLAINGLAAKIGAKEIGTKAKA